MIKDSPDKRKMIYFEKQTKFNSDCGVYALNNLLGKNAFTNLDLNQISKQLSTDLINPYKHFLGGDFDVSVLIIALQRNNYECLWLDNRKKKQKCKSILAQNPRIVGYLINREQHATKFKSFIQKAVGLSGRHWIAVKLHQNRFYQIDSKLNQPVQLIHSIQNFIEIEMERQSHLLQVLTMQPQQKINAMQKQ